MANIIKENVETYVAPVYYAKNGKIAFYEKVTTHYVGYDNNSGELIVIRQKISKKNYEKLLKNA